METKIDAKRMRGMAAAMALGFLLAFGAAGGAHADPAGGSRAGHAQRAKPRAQGNHTHHTEVQRTEHGHTRSDTWTGADGKSATRDAEVVNDRAHQTRSRDVEWTGPNGQRATRTDLAQRTDDGYVRNSTATGPNGGTVERDVVASRDAENQAWVKDVTVERTPPPKGD